MTVFITGGCKNGKSTFALKTARKLADDGPKYYLATLIPHDDEDLRCVANHQAARAGLGFQTIEMGRDISRCLELADPSGTFLLDSVTALLNNEMFPDLTGYCPQAGEKIMADLTPLLERCGNLILVSDYIQSGCPRLDPTSAHFRRTLADLERFLARKCDCAVEICVGLPIFLKGSLPDSPTKENLT